MATISRLAVPRSEARILAMQERIRLRQPLYDPSDPDLDDRDGFTEIRAANGTSVGLALTGAAVQTVQGERRQRSAREIALGKRTDYRRREATRKRALRAAAALLWLFVIPQGPTLQILARTRGEARTLARQALGLARRIRLPRGVHADFLTGAPCSRTYRPTP